MENRFGPEAHNGDKFDENTDEAPVIAQLRQVLGAHAAVWLEAELTEEAIESAELEKKFETQEERCMRFTQAYIVAASGLRDILNASDERASRKYYPGFDEEDPSPLEPHPLYTLRENLLQEMTAVSAERPETA